jgi:hypothetical protein
VQSPCAHRVCLRAEQIVNLAPSRCERLSQGVGARRRLFARPAWPRRTLLWHDHQRALLKPASTFPLSLRHHVSPRAEQKVNLTLSTTSAERPGSVCVFSRCQRLPQGLGARRRLFARPAWPGRTLLWHDHQRASLKPASPFPPSLRHLLSPRAGRIVNLTLSRCQRLP